MFEEARALKTTMKMRKMSQKEMASSLGVSQSYVANKLRLLKLDTKMQEQITKHNLTERHARALLRLDRNDARKEILDRICKEKLSVARTEALVDSALVQEAVSMQNRGEGLKIIYSFIDSTTHALEVIRAHGYFATRKIYHENQKTFITICIEEIV